MDIVFWVCYFVIFVCYVFVVEVYWFWCCNDGFIVVGGIVEMNEIDYDFSIF